ncbi:hypothetical protein EMIHUDRAFT_452240 [Emiliania huxleyi CCMP1516]|uniref:SET domain-containing protein n=2 Tax=Emiliania huxleyi TaxID=2903 RepID=A0A0D3ILB2_EMIH1|nr:hypothetical protein EMIHUDRAFT_452240 [Emiliania huxleyi CCMP1516]EOD12047.1 hypothetical protein EMIHUDRAFT_452240 [Emiliania huxleyi CCMP1516]|eukprot:XP_005764476.1 hypothetical protein EMIHUDRAFT_452240 [Emiliania huxleyi CCMP1516]
MRADEQREAARAAAEEAWVDERVAEGESRRVLEVTPPGDAAHWAELVASRPVDGGGGERKPDSTGTARWHEALAPWGLTLAAAGAVGGGGRGLVTTRSFKRGEVLMRVTPAVAVVSGRHLSSRCHHSHATGGRLLVCSRCGCARYCSADHQRAAWAGHRDECALLAQTRPRVPGQTVRLLARLLALLRRSAGAPPPEDAGEWARSAAAILSLSHQLGGQPAERCAEFGEQAGMVCSLIQEAARSGGGWAGSSERVHLQRVHLQRVHLQRVHLQRVHLQRVHLQRVHLQRVHLQRVHLQRVHLQRVHLQREIGIGLYPLAALANHDCDPTAAQSFGAAGKLTLRALRPLAAGEAVTIGYVDLAAAASERRQALRSSYLFTCECRACEEALAPTPAARKREAARCEAAASLREEQRAELAAIDAADWEAALRRSTRAAEIAASLLPPGAPALGLQLLRAGSLRRRGCKLHAHCGSLRESVGYLRRATEVLQAVHGEAAPLVRDAAEMLRGAQLELAYGDNSAAS